MLVCGTCGTPTEADGGCEVCAARGKAPKVQPLAVVSFGTGLPVLLCGVALACITMAGELNDWRYPGVQLWLLHGLAGGSVLAIITGTIALHVVDRTGSRGQILAALGAACGYLMVLVSGFLYVVFFYAASAVIQY